MALDFSQCPWRPQSCPNPPAVGEKDLFCKNNNNNSRFEIPLLPDLSLAKIGRKNLCFCSSDLKNYPYGIINRENGGHFLLNLWGLGDLGGGSRNLAIHQEGSSPNSFGCRDELFGQGKSWICVMGREELVGCRCRPSYGKIF